MTTDSSLIVTKASGVRATFDPQRLRASLQRAGASPAISETIVEEILPQLVPGISTKKIHRMAFKLLGRRSSQLAGRYRLKQAIMDLGPSGFPFEKFIARILEHDGYQVEVGRIVEGKCVKHEVDVIAQKEEHHFMVECKYHNQPGRVCDVKIPLYVQGRFKDIEQRWVRIPGHGARFHQGWVATNTRFTSDALQYGECAGLHMMSWDHPLHGSLRDRIDRSGLYPLTCLTTLSSAEKKRILEQGAVLCQEICSDPALLSKAGVAPERVKKVLEEGAGLCATLMHHARH